MGIIIVEVCDSNRISSIELEALEAEYPGVSVLRTDCLSHCGLCQHQAYAYVNGKIVFAKDADTCLVRIKQRIEYELALMDELD